ncbi:MAG: hypothetical protein ABI882_16000 [Acidobacteriota bacterium]
MTMKRTPILLTLLATMLIAAASVASAHEKVKLTGYVVDVMCFAEHVKEAPDAATNAASEHTKECALMEDCVKSGYGIYADGKWYPFDGKGNDLAKTLFEKTGKDKNIKMTVEGMKHDGKILVEKMTEVE